ncbi:heterodisulfide reductase-related iron-sulfur binding cluster [Desulfosporosinus sp. Sb-LF]|uniref:heterodisulfide reductase-related iron-sulfur binding cluster n=1 Tax=Desulfosporosinus sp. Sb-LF TaxID=2560027 RepID=UPI00107F41CA|nr:heterodisulfide reductase-related iron-sulfur binding cluster [Desulfosporosinus sp. Sb-LF]TGE33269.1 4Fe-4S dicluster domain-containing protein [Desulfosporosinus sp. Sb-LF]
MEEETRQIYWNIHGKELMYLFALVAFLIFTLGCYKKIKSWEQGRPIRYDNFVLRLKMCFSVVIKHDTEIFRGTFRRFMHLGVFYGFLILTLGTLVIAIQDHFGIPLFYGKKYLILSFLMDIFGLIAMIGIGMATYKRYIDKPDHDDYTLDDAVLLILTFSILFTGFVIEGLRIYVTDDLWAYWTPVGLFFSVVFQLLGFSIQSALSSHASLWYFHMLLAFGFIAYIPHSKLFHMIASSLNIFLRSLNTIGGLTSVERISTEDMTIGSSRLEEFSKKQLLELDACISCGRCQKGCPAYSSGAPLSPRIMIQRLKRHSIEQNSWFRVRDKIKSLPLTDKVISKETLWSCTTCGLCEDKCPIFIEHIKRIVDMRRSLSTESTDYPPEVQKVYKGISEVGNPWGLRLDRKYYLTKESKVSLLSSEKRQTDILYWVGCFGSYESRNKKVSQIMFKILENAGVDYAILGMDENCCGDSVRRLGNEKLFQTLALKNIETLNRYKFKTIVTHCPHCYNTLKNDYQQFGGHYHVIHHSELILDFLKSGKIVPKLANERKVTFHDPCYLGRYNGIYEAPRDVLTSIPGLELVEMKNNRSKAFCCGAGGGRIWMEDNKEQAINGLLFKKALRTEPDILASSCPLCLTTLTEAGKSSEIDIQIMDIAEIVCESL